MAVKPRDADKIRERVETYADWITRLRTGMPVPQLRPTSADPLARLGQELQLLAEALTRREREFRQLFDTVQRMGQGISLEDVLNRVFEGFVGLIPYERIGCAFLSSDGATVTAYWARSVLGGAPIMAGYSRPLAGSSLEEILETGEPRIINDLKGYLLSKPNSDATRRIVREGGRSSLTCPLIVERRPVGFLFFTSARRDTYSEAHQSIFRQIASQVSIVVDKGRVYQQILDRNHQLMEQGRVLEEAANRDDLTGVLNRGGIMRVVESAFADAVAQRERVGLIMVDIDHFKKINDSWGHVAGDHALKEFAQRLAAALRRSDLIGRYGGEEFLVVMTNANREAVDRAGERLRRVIADTPFRLGDKVRTVTASLGGAIAGASGDSPEDVLAAADRALYAAKNSGRNRMILDDPDSGEDAALDNH